VRHRLPSGQGAKPAYWEVGSGSGPETILVLAATAANSELEQELERFPHPLAGERGKPRGLSRVIEGESPRGRELEDLARRSAAQGLLTWKIQVRAEED
jgi:hypothetical protein